MKLRRSFFVFLWLNLYMSLSFVDVNAQSITNSINNISSGSRFSNQPQGPVRGYNFFDQRPITDQKNQSQCGFKPMPNVGCEIGECINGQWKQNCVSDEFECGFKPIPNVGCEVGECLNGVWQIDCKGNPELACGLKPFPVQGCQIGECKNGSWQQICE